VQEVLAVVVVVLPGVLPVKEDRHQVRPLRPGLAQRGLDVVQARQQVGGGCLTGHAGILEPDLVGEQLVAEEDGHPPAAPAPHLIGTVQRVRLEDGIGAVAGEVLHVRQAAGQHFLVGGHPADAGVGHHLHDLGRDRAFRRPHATRRAAKVLLVHLHPQLHLGDGILAEDKPLRQLGIRHRHRRHVAVDQQRQDRVGKGRHRDLDLAGIL